MKRAAALALGSVLIGGCSVGGAPSFTPFQTESGGLGFVVSGLAPFTSDRSAVERQVRSELENACGGAISDVQITLDDASSPAGVSHISYVGRAACD